MGSEMCIRDRMNAKHIDHPAIFSSYLIKHRKLHIEMKNKYLLRRVAGRLHVKLSTLLVWYRKNGQYANLPQSLLFDLLLLVQWLYLDSFLAN